MESNNSCNDNSIFKSALSIAAIGAGAIGGAKYGSRLINKGVLDPVVNIGNRSLKNGRASSQAKEVLKNRTVNKAGNESIKKRVTRPPSYMEILKRAGKQVKQDASDFMNSPIFNGE